MWVRKYYTTTKRKKLTKAELAEQTGRGRKNPIKSFKKKAIGKNI